MKLSNVFHTPPRPRYPSRTILGFYHVALTSHRNWLIIGERALSCLFFALQRPKNPRGHFSIRSSVVNVDITVTGILLTFYSVNLCQGVSSRPLPPVSRTVESITLSFEIKFTASPLTRWFAQMDHTLKGLNSDIIIYICIRASSVLSLRGWLAAALHSFIDVPNLRGLLHWHDVSVVSGEVIIH